MPSLTLKERLDRDLASLDEGARRVDVALEFESPDREIILSGGGQWDTSLYRYVAPVAIPHRVRLVSSQMRAARQLAQWFEAYDRGDARRSSLVIYVDQRRGGKTWFVVAKPLLIAIRYPVTHLGRTICVIVVPTYPQQREIHETVRGILPTEWFRDKRVAYHKAENYYEFATGAQIWIKSADREQTLKIGKITAVSINEAQQVTDDAVLFALGGTIDEGGIGALAMNPPDSLKGIWAEELHDAVNATDAQGKPMLEFAEEIPFPATQNEVINQKARTNYARLAEVINPDRAKRDAMGMRVSVKDRAYPKYNRACIRPQPTSWRDVTAEVNNLTNKIPTNRVRSFGAGMDYQRRPWCAYIEAKVFVAPPGAWVPAGTHVYCINGEITNDVPAGDYWTEEELLDEIATHLGKHKRSPADYLLIGDATGKNQGASGEQRGKDSDPDTWSWAICERYGWEPHGAIEKPRWKSRGKGKGGELVVSPRNPRVPDRMNLVNRLLAENRLIFSGVPKTAESFRICEVVPNTRKPRGRGAHLTDAVSYLLYVWEMALIETGVVRLTQ